MKDKLRNSETDNLFKAILTLENIDECYNFFSDLCTVAEIKEMSNRFLVAQMLNDKIVYSKIAEKTGLSTATITRVNRCLKYGNDGYQLQLERLKDNKNKKQ